MWLKQSTPVTIKFGPFVDDADGKTVEIALTIQKANVRLSKNGGNIIPANANQGGGDAGAPYDEVGEYDISLDDTDTNTLGRLKVMVNAAGALPVWQSFMIVPANVWDSFFGADRLVVDVEEIGTDVITAAALNADAAAEIAATVLCSDSSLWEASAGKKSLGAAVMAAVHKIEDDGAGHLIVYRSNGTTEHYRRTIVTNAAADPVTELDGAV